jgi:hypothetical protein
MLALVPRPSASAQARLAIARYRAEKNGSHPLSEIEVARLDDLTIFEQLYGTVLIDNYSGPTLTWREVFYSPLPLNLSGMAHRAKENGFRWFAHESIVYFVSSKGMIHETGLTVSEIT